MKITDAIQMADELAPNMYPYSMKLNWAYELTAQIAEEVRKIYNSMTAPWHEDGSPYILPEGVMFEDIESIFVDGKKYTKTDARSWGIYQTSANGFAFYPGAGTHKTVTAVYKAKPPKYRDIHLKKIQCTCGGTNDNMIYASKSTYASNPFEKLEEADTIIMSEFESAESTTPAKTATLDILELDETETQYIIVVGDGKTDGFSSGFYDIDYILLDETPVPPAYESMYIDYILGKIAFYQKDMEDYNCQMSMFNSKYLTYMNWYKATNPIDKTLRFHE